MELFSHHITHLKNGNFLFNDKEIEFSEFPRPILFEIFRTECEELPGKFRKELTNDDQHALTCFIEYAERNGYQFPTIPPKELFLRYEAEHTYYKYGERFQREITTKPGITVGDNYVLARFREFVLYHKLMTETELDRYEKGWREKIQNETKTETVWDRKPIEEHGKKVIDWNQQKRQDEVNKLIRTFYNWIVKYVK